MSLKEDIKPYKWILDYVKSTDSYPKQATDKDWFSLVDIHYKYVKKSKGVKECTGCSKYFTVCKQISNELDARSRK